jgi:hypothetical protein
MMAGKHQAYFFPHIEMYISMTLSLVSLAPAPPLLLPALLAGDKSRVFLPKQRQQEKIQRGLAILSSMLVLFLFFAIHYLAHAITSMSSLFSPPSPPSPTPFHST